MASYDYAALLYLSGGPADFPVGGELAFLDADADRLVEPRAGRFVAFTAGAENLHAAYPIEPSKPGERPATRLVLSMWFTCSEAHAAVDAELL